MYSLQMNTIDLVPSITDPDGGNFRCYYNSLNDPGNYFADVPTLGSDSFMVTNDCKLEWDLSNQYPVSGSKWAVSMFIENADLAPGTARMGLDFIVEVIEASLSLTCDASTPTSVSVFPGQTVTLDFLVNDGGENSFVGDVSVAVAGAAGATITTFAGTGDLLPQTWTFNYPVPTIGAAATAQFTVQWSLTSGVNCFHPVTVNIFCNGEEC